jgi:hypothetical protein
MHTRNFLAILLAGHLLVTASAAAGTRQLLTKNAAGGPDTLQSSQQQTRLRSLPDDPMPSLRTFELDAHADGAASHPMDTRPQQLQRTGARKLLFQYAELSASNHAVWGLKPKAPKAPNTPSFELAVGSTGVEGGSGARKLRAVHVMKGGLHAKPCFTTETCTRTLVLQ